MSMSPYDTGPMQPYDEFGPDEDFEPMQMRGGGGSSWQPGWRPPSRPSCGPPWQQGPGPGGWPFWGYWGFRLRSAWRDVKFLHKLITDIVNEMIDDGLIMPGPNAPATGPGSGGGTTTGVKGVTDGSDAGPGMVGEFVTGNATFSFAAATGQYTGTVNPLILQPGDWDIRVTATLNTSVTNFAINLSPVPTGVSNSMQANAGIGGAAFADLYGVLMAMARANVSVPTLLPFAVSVDREVAGTAGTITVSVEARRIR